MRRLPTVALCVLLAACLVAPASQASPAASQTDTNAQRKALLQFQHDLVSVLALRSQAQPLLGAALLARTLPDPPKTLTYHALIQRAANASDSGPAVTWAQLVDCDVQAQTCPSPDAVAKLKQQAADNAAVWLLALGVDARDMRHKAMQADLAHAADTSQYDDYTGASLQAVATAVTTLPPPPDTMSTDGPLASTPWGVQAMITFGIASAQPMPGFQVVARLCDADKVDATRRQQCLKLGKTLEWGSSPLARSLGLHLRETLSDDPVQQTDAKRARRDLVWQLQEFTRLTAQAQTDDAVAQRLLHLAAQGGTQMSLMLAALRKSGIASEAPADWQPHKS